MMNHQQPTEAMHARAALYARNVLPLALPCHWDHKASAFPPLSCAHAAAHGCLSSLPGPTDINGGGHVADPLQCAHPLMIASHRRGWRRCRALAIKAKHGVQSLFDLMESDATL
jgi:hypothetical protein